jgi:predicted alpha/beta-fold hydrolase
MTPPNQPRVHSHDNPHSRRIVAALPQLSRPYRPTPWLFNAHLQLVFLTRRQQPTGLAYDHIDRLTMADGGHTALYWLGHGLPADTPTIVVLHTITGSPHSMQELVQDLHRASGWRVVLCLRRGHADLPLASARLNILGSTDDLREQLAAIQRQFPHSPLHGVGSSAGTALLVRYLGEEGPAARLRSAFAYCPGYNTDVAFEKASPFYSRLITKNLVRQFIAPHSARLGHLATADRLHKAANLADFHRHMYELAGFSSYAEYSERSNPMRVFTGITTPIMILNAEDDPVCRISNVEPYREAMAQMPNVILVITRRGSHCAHYEGWTARSWAARLMADYFKAVEGLENVGAVESPGNVALAAG